MLDSVADLVVGNAVDSVATKLEELVALGARFSAEDIEDTHAFETYSEELFELLWNSDPDRD